MTNRSTFKSILVALVLCLPGHTLADWGPWQPPPAPTQAQDSPSEGDLSVLRFGVRFFQKYISPADGARCPMYPTCSAYALEAIDRHGAAIGTMMTVDRLFHETDPREHRHPLTRFNRIRYLDPLENNDFWFAGD